MSAVLDTEDVNLEIVIPNWNGALMLRACLDSLALQSCQQFSITVVDNGSCDESLTMLARDYPEVRVLSFSENRGFSVAVNAGLRKARSPWTLLLNNDMEVASDCIARLIQGIAQYPDYDFFALKMYNFHEREFLDGAGDAVLRGGVGYRIGTMERDRERYRTDRSCFGACAGAALYHQRVFERVGYFDEDFFAYLEDVDLNVRASMAGLNCMYLASAKVFHIGSASTGSKFNDMTIRLSTRNNFNLLLKNYPGMLFLRFFPAICVYQLMWFLFCLKKKMLSAWLRGVCEAFSPQNMILFRKKYRKAWMHKSLGEIWAWGGCIVRAEREAVQSIIARRRENGKNNLLITSYLFLFC